MPQCSLCNLQHSQASANMTFNCKRTLLNLKLDSDSQPKLTCYLLTSLRDHSINYIGTTTQKLCDRLAYHNTGRSHLQNKYPNKGPWICTSSATGFGNDVKIMNKFQKLWSKEMEQAMTSLRQNISFDIITRIGKIISKSPQFQTTPIKVTRRYNCQHNTAV